MCAYIECVNNDKYFIEIIEIIEIIENFKGVVKDTVKI